MAEDLSELQQWMEQTNLGDKDEEFEAAAAEMTEEQLADMHEMDRELSSSVPAAPRLPSACSTCSAPNSHISSDGDDISVVQIVPPSELPAAVYAAPPEQMAKDVTSSTSSIFQIRFIEMQNDMRPILYQNENGPCPLLAVCNVLLLRGRLELPHGAEHVSYQQLLQLLSGLALDEDTSSLSEAETANRSAAVESVFNIFPSLLSGLDINVGFSAVDDFEFTPELGIFDLFHIPLYHGWIVDPQDKASFEALRGKKYNQLVAYIAENINGEESGNAAIAQEWLDVHQSQLSYHGLAELSETIPEQGFAVLFRNNHFVVVFKHKRQLLLLMTDIGFRNTPVIWETLSNVDNDSLFFNHSFVRVDDQAPPSQDELLAQRLQSEEFASGSGSAPGPAVTQSVHASRAASAPSAPETDEELARRLQQEENEHAQTRRRRSDELAPPNGSTPPHNAAAKQRRNCSIM